MSELIIEEKQKQQDSVLITVLRFRGSVDATTFSGFKEHLEPYLTDNRRLVLNFSELRYMNSTGFGLLATLCRKLQACDGNLVIAEPHRDFFHIFKLLGFNRVIQSYETSEEAFQAVISDGN